MKRPNLLRSFEICNFFFTFTVRGLQLPKNKSDILAASEEMDYRPITDKKAYLSRMHEAQSGGPNLADDKRVEV